MKGRHLALFCILIMGACFSKSRREDALFNPTHEEWDKEAPDIARVRMETSKGDFVIELHRAWAPIGVDRFYNLVRMGFYDDSRFYRVRKDFIVQFGIAGKPEVAQVWEKVEINDDPVVESNKRGYISFAMTGPNTRTTQVYINLSDNTELDEQGFAPLGYVVEGMGVVDSLYSGYDDNSGGGMRRGKQQKLFELGNTYLDKEFPNLDKLMDTEILKNEN
ncbi:MAG TPA: peptidylprolyl isomerase [Cyclobacteriaceae bacterium]|nr:peptidylprolyl isomerase [Cyclobacteriaceae bacterium]